MDGVCEKYHQTNRLLTEKQWFFHKTDNVFGALYYESTLTRRQKFLAMSKCNGLIILDGLKSHLMLLQTTQKESL